MGFNIEDGTGKGYIAKVDANNRVHVDAISNDNYAAASTLGDAYTINSGYITLTGSSTTNALLFVENNGDNDLGLVRFNLNNKASAGTSETHGRFIFYRNPGAMTGGTGATITPRNLNFGSSNTLTLSTERGQNVASFTNTSEAFGSPVVPLQTITFIDSVAVIPKGTSLGVSYVTPDSNTSIQVAVGLNVYEIRED